MNPKQRQATGLLFAFAFLTAATYVVTRTMAISAFLARIGSDAIPACILGAALTVMACSVAGRYLARRIDPGNVVAIVWVLLGLGTYWLAVTIPRYGDTFWALGAVYVFAEIRGCFNTIYLVTLLNEAFASSDTKRPFAIVASGAPVAGIVVGLILGMEASTAKLVPTLALMCVLDFAVAILIWFNRRKLTDASKGDSRSRIASSTLETQSLHRKEAGSSEHRYRIQLSAIVALKILVLTMIGYQWKVAVGDYFGSDEERMVKYFALFYAISDVIIVTLQWCASGDLLDRYGIGFGLVGFPIALLIVGFVSLFTNSVVALMVLFTVARGLHVLRRSIHDPALAAAYTILRPGIRRETIVLVKGLIKPFAEAVTGATLILVGASLTHVGTTVIWLFAIPVWLLFSLRATREFYRWWQSGQGEIAPMGDAVPVADLAKDPPR